MKNRLILLGILFVNIFQSYSQEVFSVDSINRTLTPSGQRYYLAHPFEITYGPDDSLYITEKIGRVRIVSALTGRSRIILDHRANTHVNISYSGGVATNIGQNGMMGLALHKDFKALPPATAVNNIYIAYSYNSTSLRISQFTYNVTTGMLGSEVILISGIPAGNDHSSGRLIYGPDDKLYYSCGDQGANQFNARCNEIRAQMLPTSAEISASNYMNYQGKILRINLNGSVPADNPLFDPDGAGPLAAVRSHIYTYGHRNPQGLAFEINANDGSSYPTLINSGRLYSSEHGVRTDDEINIISAGNNYAWPYWSGFRNNPAENYRYINWSTASGTNCSSTAYNEVTIPTGATVINENAYSAGSFTDPILSMYPACNGAGNCNVTLTTGTNWMQYPTVAPSSIDHYGFTNIPGWYRSLLVTTLRRGTLYRFNLNASGNGISGDSIPYFFRSDRYRDIAIKNGTIFFLITDSIGSTSGPSGSGTSNLSRPGTIMKYSFLGYQHNAGTNKSTIPTTISISNGTTGSCIDGSRIIIDATNNNYWVPITGPDGNILAEIKANGNNLGLVTTSYYKNGGAIRTRGSVKYLDRNITIVPEFQPSSAVSVRLYITNQEFNALDADPLSGINGIGDLKILKNSDNCGPNVGSTTTLVNPIHAELFGSTGYVLQANINLFSTFYFGSANLTLPLDLITFKGALQRNGAALLKWETANEKNSSHFILERSIDGSSYSAIASIQAFGNTATNKNYSYLDATASGQQVPILFYRLKIVDIDGAFVYSNIVTISLADITGSVSVFPNPVNNLVKVTMVAAMQDNVQWKLIDNMGRILLSGKAKLNAGHNSLDLHLVKLAVGNYYLSVRGAGIDKNIKIQKL